MRATVEIIDYLGRSRRTIALMVLVPLAGAGAAAAIAGMRPPGYLGRTVVAAPALVGGATGTQYSGAQATQQFVNAFIAAATTPPVVDRVVADTHVSYRSVVGGTAIAESGSSSVLTVTFTGRNRAQAGAVAQAVAQETLRFLFDSQVALAAQELTAATKSYDALQKKADAMVAANNGIAPDQAAASVAQEVTALQQQEAQQQAAGNFTAAASLASAVRAKQQLVSAMSPSVASYQRLVDQLDNAQVSRQTAQQQLLVAREQQSAADPSTVVFPRATHKAPRVGPTLRIALPAAGVGILLAAALVLMMEELGRRRDTHAPTGVDHRGPSALIEPANGLVASVPPPRPNGRPL